MAPLEDVARVGTVLRALLLLVVALLAGACADDPVEPDVTDGEEVGVVLNSVDLSLSVFEADSPGETRAPVGLGPDGSPVDFAVRDEIAAVPMGFVPALVVVDLGTGSVVRTVSLPTGSGATGAAFLNDSVVLVANPNLDTVVPVNVLRGTLGQEIPVGGFPQRVVRIGSRTAVLNAELGPDFLPTGPGTVTVLSADGEVQGEITLSGTNPGAAVPAGGDRAWVLSSGSFGAADGSLSLVDMATRIELGHWEGFGEFPGGLAVGPTGRLHVSSFGYGLAVWDPSEETFDRSPADPVTPEGTPSVSGLAFDSDGRLHTLRPDCAAPSAAHRLDAGWAVSASWPVGTCPIALAFTHTGG